MWFAFHCYQSKVINKITDKNQLQIDSGLRAMKIDVALSWMISGNSEWCWKYDRMIALKVATLCPSHQLAHRMREPQKLFTDYFRMENAIHTYYYFSFTLILVEFHSCFHLITPSRSFIEKLGTRKCVWCVVAGSCIYFCEKRGNSVCSYGRRVWVRYGWILMLIVRGSTKIFRFSFEQFS